MELNFQADVRVCEGGERAGLNWLFNYSEQTSHKISHAKQQKGWTRDAKYLIELLQVYEH